MNSTSRVGPSSSISVVSCIESGGMVSSFVSADRWAAHDSSLYVAIHQVDLLQPSQALADVLGPDLPHSLDRLERGVRGGQQLFQAAELAHYLGDDELGQSGDAA